MSSQCLDWIAFFNRLWLYIKAKFKRNPKRTSDWKYKQQIHNQDVIFVDLNTPRVFYRASRHCYKLIGVDILP